FRILASYFTVRDLPKVRFVRVVVVGLEITERRRHGIEAVISNGDGLRVLEFREGLHDEAKIDLRVVAFRGRDVGSMRDGFAGQQTDPRIVAAFGDVVADLQLVFSPAKFAGGASREIVRKA